MNLRSKKTVAVVGAAVVTIGGFFVIKNTRNPMTVPAYKVARVVDGDTFDTTERQIIRVASADAPEIGLCGAEEATKALEKLILNKKLYLKVIFRDSYNRLVSLVYTEEGLVNENLIREGWAVFNGYDYGKMRQAMVEAKEKKLGIFGNQCTQTSNTVKPKCVIKGNVDSDKQSIKQYRFPGCGQYATTFVQLFEGDQWFCTEAEAKKAGFSKGKDCFEMVWE